MKEWLATLHSWHWVGAWGEAEAPKDTCRLHLLQGKRPQGALQSHLLWGDVQPGLSSGHVAVSLATG